MNRYIKDTIDKTFDSIKHFKNNPLYNLKQIIPVWIVLVSLVGFIIAFVQFVVSGKYVEQFNYFKENFFSLDFFRGVSKGTTTVLLAGIIPKIVFVSVFVNFIIILVLYNKKERKIKKVFMDLFLVVGLTLAGITSVFLGISDRTIHVSESTYDKIFDFFSKYEIEQVRFFYNIVNITRIIGFVFLIIVIISLFCSEHRNTLKDTVVALVVSFIVLPLLLFLIENVIPLCASVISIIIVICVFALGFVLLISSLGNSTGTSSKTHTNNNGNIEKNKKQKRVTLDLNTTFWVDEDFIGCKNIYYKDAWGTKNNACTVHEFEKGEVAIFDKGQRIMNVPGCKTPER